MMHRINELTRWYLRRLQCAVLTFSWSERLVVSVGLGVHVLHRLGRPKLMMLMASEMHITSSAASDSRGEETGSIEY